MDLKDVLIAGAAVFTLALGCETSSRSSSIPVKAKAVASGGFHSCAILTDGRVKCWGTNLLGELGLGDVRTRGDHRADLGDALPDTELGARAAPRAIAAGASHTCVLSAAGEISCWGANDSGQLGLGDRESRGDDPGEMGQRLPRVELGAQRKATAIALGDAHTCALLETGLVACWGANELGQLGLGDAEARGDEGGELGDDLSTAELGADRAQAIAAGGATTCVLIFDGSIKCWGANESGQLGLGDRSPRGDDTGEMGPALPSVPLGVGVLAKAIAVSAAGHCCALLHEGAIKCWGANDFGQLGVGDTRARGDDSGEMGDALPAVDLGAGLRASALSLGGGHGCALLDDRSTKCWGYNGYANLGLEDFEARGVTREQMGAHLPAVSLGSARFAVALAPSRVNHTCALLDDGSVKCWGSNGVGQLGQGDTRSRGGRPGELGDALLPVELGGSDPTGSSFKDASP